MKGLHHCRGQHTQLGGHFLDWARQVENEFVGARINILTHARDDLVLCSQQIQCLWAYVRTAAEQKALHYFERHCTFFNNVDT